MRAGDLSVTSYGRTVRKQLNTELPDRRIPLMASSRVQAWESNDLGCMITAQAICSGRMPMIGKMAAMQALNELALQKAAPRGLMLQVLFPTEMREKKLELTIEETLRYCHQAGTPVTDVITQVMPGLSRMILTAQAVGSTSKEECRGQSGTLSPSDKELSIIQCGLAALEGSLWLLNERRASLEEQFSNAFLRECEAKESELLGASEISRILSDKTVYAQQIRGGGIFAALWDVSEQLQSGFRVSLEAVDLCQETIEILEHFHLNPYEMTSAGSILIVTEDGDDELKRIREMGIRAARLGVISQDKAKILTGKTEERFLDRPAPDELMSFWEQES